MHACSSELLGVPRGMEQAGLGGDWLEGVSRSLGFEGVKSKEGC